MSSQHNESIPVKKQPVYFKKNGNSYSLMAPDGQFLNWVAGESNIIACPGDRNFVTKSNLYSSHKIF